MKSAITLNGKAVVSSKGQVVIPKEVRERLGIHAGHELLFTVKEDGTMEVKPMSRSIDMFFGRCERAGEAAMSTEEIDAAITQAVIENDLNSKK
jgi:AbrB family looped-hinge helix DNA binding protein